MVYEEGKTEYTVECGGIIGDSVKIRQHHQYLSLCEVKVIQGNNSMKNKSHEFHRVKLT